MDVLIAALIALGVQGVRELGPQVIELLSTLVKDAIAALMPAKVLAQKPDALGELLATAVRVVHRLDTDPGLTGEQKRSAAQRILTRWNVDNAGGGFSASEINLVLELAVQHVRRKE